MYGQPKKTRAIVFPTPCSVEVAELDLPVMEEDDILVKIDYSAVSPGTERWMLQGRLEIPGEPPFAFPHVPGYQAAGIVAAAGPRAGAATDGAGAACPQTADRGSVTHHVGIRAGDRVFSRACRSPAGWEGSWWGGHCEYHVAKTGRDIIRVPDKVTTEAAACLLLAQVGYNGAMKPAVREGDVAVVIGDGLVGQYAAQVLTCRGAHTVISGLSPERLALAGKYSAAEVYDNRNFDFPAYMARRYPAGADVVLETASTMKTVEEAAGMLKRHGQLVLNGYYPPGDSCIDWHWLRRKELTLYCADSRNDERLQNTMTLIAGGAIRAEELITRRFAPDQAPEAYSMLLGDRQDFLGLMIDWR